MQITEVLWAKFNIASINNNKKYIIILIIYYYYGTQFYKLSETIRKRAQNNTLLYRISILCPIFTF